MLSGGDVDQSQSLGGQALQAVKESRVALMMEWDESRPNDQKLENSQARMVKAARDGRK